MSRKGPIPKRAVTPDPIFGSRLVTQATNQILQGGKKSIAQKIIYGAFDIVKEKTKKDPLEIFKTAVDNTRPLLKVKSRRVGGATYQVPIEVTQRQGVTLSLRWIIGFAKAREKASMAQRLAVEIMDAASGTGSAVKKKDDTHKMAEANRAFAHYRW